MTPLAPVALLLDTPAMSFPAGSRVRFSTTRGELLGTVLAVLEDELHTVRPDVRGLPVMLLLERSLQPEADEADVPLVVTG